MTLLMAIDCYVQRKRVSGLQFKKGEEILTSFCRHYGNRRLDALSTRHIGAFLDRPGTGTATWRHKYGVLKHFFDYWSARDEMPQVLMPPAHREERSTFVPYIYPRMEVRRLLRKTRMSQRTSLTVDARTLRSLVLFLYATGARLGETVDLKLRDVDLQLGRITFRGTRFNRKRCIPIVPESPKSIAILRKSDTGTTGRGLASFRAK